MTREVAEVLARALVDDPDAVEVREKYRRGHTVHLEVRVPQPQMGKVIGRGGRIAQAIRTVVNAAAARENARAIVDIEAL